MKFGEAIELARQGLAVARLGWNGKAMWVSASPGSVMNTALDKPWGKATQAFLTSQQARGVQNVTVLPYFVMRTASGDLLLGWLASQTDMLATDWVEVDAA